MTTPRPFSADSNKLAYAQAFSRASTRPPARTFQAPRLRSLLARRARKHAA